MVRQDPNRRFRAARSGWTPGARWSAAGETGSRWSQSIQWTVDGGECVVEVEVEVEEARGNGGMKSASGSVGSIESGADAATSETPSAPRASPCNSTRLCPSPDAGTSKDRYALDATVKKASPAPSSIRRIATAGRRLSSSRVASAAALGPHTVRHGSESVEGALSGWRRPQPSGARYTPHLSAGGAAGPLDDEEAVGAVGRWRAANQGAHRRRETRWNGRVRSTASSGSGLASSSSGERSSSDDPVGGT